MIAKGDGSPSAKIMIVGEAWGEQEERTGIPFQGASGQLLNSMLHEADIMRSECYVTNLVNSRPPYNDLGKWVAEKKKDITATHTPLLDKMVMPIVVEGYRSLQEEIALVHPNVIIACGNYAMWALTGKWGVLKWRGSQLQTPSGLKCIPTIHPAAVLREYPLRPIIVNDLKRAAKERSSITYEDAPDWRFLIRPSFRMVIDTLEMLEKKATLSPVWVDFDLETSPRHITCAGISWSRTEALCIPFCVGTHSTHYWSEEEEAYIIWRLYQLLTNPNILVRGQNLLYDCQHTNRWWFFVPNVKQDTMISMHTAFAGMRKSLDFQASLFCENYTYWKSMHKDDSNKQGA